MYLNVDLCSRVTWKMKPLGENPRDWRRGHNADPVVATEFDSRGVVVAGNEGTI